MSDLNEYVELKVRPYFEAGSLGLDRYLELGSELQVSLCPMALKKGEGKYSKIGDIGFCVTPFAAAGFDPITGTNEISLGGGFQLAWRMGELKNDDSNYYIGGRTSYNMYNHNSSDVGGLEDSFHYQDLSAQFVIGIHADVISDKIGVSANR